MTEHRTSAATALFALAMAGAAVAGAPVERHLFVDAQLEVGADGSIREVRFSDALDPRIAALLEPHVKLTRFAAQPAGAGLSTVTTHARFSACLRADGEALAVSTKYLNHGPRVEGSGHPPIPHSLIRGTPVGSYTMAMTYTVQPDGSAALDEIDWGNVPKGVRRSAESDYRRWFKRARFEVERVDGQPVATRIALPIDLKITRHVGLPPPPQPSCAGLREALQPSPRVLAGPLRHDEDAVGEG